MAERKNVVTMQGKPLTLVGKEVKVGENAPDFEVLDTDLKPIKLSSSKGKITLILSVPSLDTSVCSRETHRFSEEVAKMNQQLVVLAISMDLPFALKRWCVAEGVKNIRTASDHRTAEFGEKYGVLIKELRLLARSAFVVDEKGVIRHVHLCKEITEEPPYAQILGEVNQLLAASK